MQTKPKRLTSNRKRFIKPLLWMTAFVIIGLVTLLLARAATPTASLQPEAGVLSGSAIVVADSNASGNNAVLFRQAGPVQTGVWKNVTPGNMNLGDGDCDSYGAVSAAVDPTRPANIYVHVNCFGIWKSTDYGATWSGPINAGAANADTRSCAGGIALGKGDTVNAPPIIYQGCIRGSGLGFWRSTDDGQTWVKRIVTPNAGNQDVMTPAVDPYNSKHLLIGWHHTALVIESFDSGDTWAEVPITATMKQSGGPAMIFVDTGNAATTANTWLYVPEAQDGTVGTWRTTNGGDTWTRVGSYERPHGPEQVFQPDKNGVIYMSSGAGDQGVLRSTNYGATWTHVGNNAPQAVVFGSPNKVYSMWSWACKRCAGTVSPNWQGANAPGTTWQDIAMPADGLPMGPSSVATTFDGTHYIHISATWNYGVWRFVEP